jgi:anti-anti-sigma regulatory factor
VLRIEGSIPAEWAALLERACSHLLRRQEEVILDLTAMDFVDLAGGGILIRLTQRGVAILRPAGEVALINTQRR